MSVICTSALFMQKTCLWQLLLQLARRLALTTTGSRPLLQLGLMQDTSLLTFHQHASGQHLCPAYSDFMYFLKSHQHSNTPSAHHDSSRRVECVLQCSSQLDGVWEAACQIEQDNTYAWNQAIRYRACSLHCIA